MVLAFALTMAVAASSASAASQTVMGSVGGMLALSANSQTVALSAVQPGQTAEALGTITATSTTTNWRLDVLDGGSGAGHMVSGPSGCSGSDSRLTDALTVSAAGAGIASAGRQSIADKPTTLAASTTSPVAAEPISLDYRQSIPEAEAITAGCVYSLTATYTLG